MKHLLAQNDFTTCTHVLTSLGGTFVRPGLQANYSLSSLDDIIRKFTLVLLSRAGSQPWTRPFSVAVSLNIESIVYLALAWYSYCLVIIFGKYKRYTYSPSQSKKAAGDCRNVLFLIQVDSLEKINLWDTIGFNCLHETAKSDIYLHYTTPQNESNSC